MAGADQVVCLFFGVVFERLNSLINKDRKEPGPSAGLVKELKKLYKTFLKIKEVLDDAEEQQFDEKAVRVRFWLQELNEAAYEADDVFDEFEYEGLHSLASQESSSGSYNVIDQLYCKIQKLIEILIQKLIEIFHNLAQECSELKLEKGKEKSVVTSPDCRTDSLLAEPQVYGRDEDSVKLVNQFSGSNQENISVFSAGGCIRRVPTKFREINEYAYTPEVISIGLFHRDKMDLKEMEVHKLQYVNSLLSRFEDRATKLEECVEAISRLEDEARKCYSEPIELNKEEFIEMMIVDGLFIIELFRKNAGEGQIDKDDPIFNNVWGLASLVRDLILFENQLPMLVLERLFKITMASQQGVKQLSELAIRFFNPLMQREESVLAKYFETGGDHLLDLLSKTFYDFPSQQLPHGVKSVQVPVPTVLMEREEIVVERAPSQGEISTSSTVKSEPQLEFKDVPSLTKLRDSGVKFKKGNNTHSFLDINFSNGVIEIPPILIRDQNFSFIRNVIAYEHGLVGHPAQMTSYVVLMNNLIQSSNDVAFLRGHGIIRNYLSDDELVSSQFQKLCNEINLANFHHSKLCIDVNAFRVTYIQKATSVLKNVYRRMVPTRWVLLAAGLLLTFDAFKLTLSTTELTLDPYLFNWQRLDFLSHVLLGIILIVMFWCGSY